MFDILYVSVTVKKPSAKLYKSFSICVTTQSSRIWLMARPPDTHAHTQKGVIKGIPFSYLRYFFQPYKMVKQIGMHEPFIVVMADSISLRRHP